MVRKQTDKIKPKISVRNLLAPDWYREAKMLGKTEEELYEMVRDYCREALRQESPDAEPDDALVELTIDMYEA